MKIFFSIIFLLMCLPILSIDVQSPDTGKRAIFPGDNFAEDWKIKGEIREFTSNGLYGHIDGGAELFLEFGFQNLLIRKYENGTDEISIEVYRMENAEAALGIYLMKCGDEKPVQGIPARNTGDPYQITILKGNNFILINNFNGKESLVPAMVRLTGGILAKLSEAGDVKPEDLFSVLPEEGRVKGSELLIRGMYSLQSVYVLGEGDILLLKDKIFGAIAQYKGKDNTTYNQLAVKYPDAGYSRNAFSHLLANLDSYIKVKEKKDDFFTFTDYKGKSGNVLLKGETLRIIFNLVQ